MSSATGQAASGKLRRGIRGRAGNLPADELNAKALALEGRTLREKRRLLLLVRTGLTLAIGYLLLFSARPGGLPAAELVFVALYISSNLIIAVLPVGILARAGFDVGLILIDTFATSFALYLLPTANADVFIFYFVIILLASISDRLILSLLAPVITSVAYLGFMMARHGVEELLQPAILLRLPFFLLAGAFYGFFVDRVRRGQAAAEAARQREGARTEFLSLITHDLKQPLWVAQQSAALLYEQVGKEGSRVGRALAAQVMVNLRRMEALTLNFLDFNRIETRGVAVFACRASLNRVVEDIFETYKPAFELRGLRASLSLGAGLPQGWFDPGQTERGLSNLLDNAVKHTPKGGVIVGRTAAEGQWVSVTIGDSGPGIRAEVGERLFGVFENGPDQQGRHSTGLGLHITRAIVEAQGGTIELDSNQPLGAWFRIRLPVASSQGEGAAATAEAGAGAADSIAANPCRHYSSAC